MTRILPDSVTAGVDFSARAALPAYPAPSWSLALHLRGPGVVNLASVAEGTGHAFAASGVVTAAWAAGEYAYAIRATNGASVVEVESGRLCVAPDIAAAGAGFDNRTHARRTLDAIEAVIAKRATLDQERYRINNRELYRTPIPDLMRLRAQYRVEVLNEERKANGGSMFKTIKVNLRPVSR